MHRAADTCTCSIHTSQVLFWGIWSKISIITTDLKSCHFKKSMFKTIFRGFGIKSIYFLLNCVDFLYFMHLIGSSLTRSCVFLCLRPSERGRLQTGIIQKETAGRRTKRCRQLSEDVAEAGYRSAARFG